MERPSMEKALSTDVVLEIVLSHLNVKDLLDCRYVSKFWNKAASSVLRRRSTMIKNISNENTLKELEECLKQSWDFPFAGLQVDQPWKLSSADGMEFFKNYGARFTHLLLGASPRARLQAQAPFINDLPRLSILELDHPGSRLPPELLDSAARHQDARVLNLPSLRTLRIYSDEIEDVLCQVCTAASASLRIECLVTSYGILKVLKSAGKLQAVSIMNVYADVHSEDFQLKVTEMLSTESPALSQLRCSSINGSLSLDGLKKILISSQHTLKELRLQEIYPCQFLSECPVLSKLTTLRLDDAFGTVFPNESVFQGKQGHKFPALKEMTLNMDLYPSIAVNLSDGLFIVPSLQKAHLRDCVGKAKIEDLARSFPNVIEIRLQHDIFRHQRSAHNTNPTDIWSVGAFRKLEKLVIGPCTIQSPTKILDNAEQYSESVTFKKFKMMNMDSFLTGIPFTICENLRKHPEQSLTDSQVNEILRDRPNLLHLKNLKELVVRVRLDESDELPEKPPFISMVSVRYALQMMPKLTVKFVYDFGSPAWCLDEEEDRDRAGYFTKLKDAFKGVQPYVELEPFSY